MQEFLEVLKSLQECDDAIAELRKQQEEIPGQIAALEQALVQKQAGVKDQETLLHQKQVQRKELEIDLEENKEKIKKYKLQLYQVKTNKEYTALLHEIKTLEDHTSQLEDAVLVLMEDADRGAKESREKEALTAGQQRFQAEKARLAEELSSISTQLEGKQEARSKLCRRIDPEILVQYERIGRVRGGRAVVTARSSGSFGKDFCGGCYSNLPPQLLNEIRRNERLITCESSGRILIWLEPDAGDTPLHSPSDKVKHG